MVSKSTWPVFLVVTTMSGFERVLIAEDDTDDYLFFTEALAKVSPSHIITRANNGLACISLLKKIEHLPHFIILDLNMPFSTQ